MFLGFAVFFSCSFFAQRERIAYLPTFDERPLHFGFYLGLNQNDFKLNLKDTSLDTDITVVPATGFKAVGSSQSPHRHCVVVRSDVS